MKSAPNVSRVNNFNLMRIVAAVCVLISHSFVLSTGNPEVEPLKSLVGISLGTLSVDFFFVCSGFLVCGSYLQRRSILLFAKARALRIFPALIAMLLLTTLFVGVFVSTHGARVFFNDPQTWWYLAKNTVLFFGVEYRLPGTFESTPYAYAVNGSLWTLPHEVRAYFAIALICWFGLRFIPESLFRLFITSICISIIGIDTIFACLNIKLPYHHFFHLFGLFSAGAVLLMFNYHRSKYLVATSFVSLLILMLSGYLGVFKLTHSLVLPLLVIGIAYLPINIFRSFNRFGDYSYGVYVYAFPIQQSLVYFFPSITIVPMIIWALLLSFFAAILSWHLVEKPFLKLK